MKRRTFLQAGLAASFAAPLSAALRLGRFDGAADVLAQATTAGQVKAAVIHVRQRDVTFQRAFGTARDEHAMFLLGSISKPIAMTALMTLFDHGLFPLDDKVQKFLPNFTGEGRETVTMRHLLSHVSGLPDQLPENDALRKKHATLVEFAEHAQRTPLAFAPGSKYQYSSMGILLAARVAELLSKVDILTLVERAVFKPLGMLHSAQGLGRFTLADMVPVQTEFAAVEAGGGDPTAKDWDWNSSYWRKLGAPWGGTHASAPDVASFLAEFLFKNGRVVRPETAQLMIANQNPAGFTPRGLGLNVGRGAGSPGCSERTFGHTGSTGTLAWADPVTQTICVVLTSLPARAVQPHPRERAGALVAAAGIGAAESKQ
ncbi:MAG: beta-lactamase family protein [Planctomycetaceae bacterium]|nr:beta-lactamase family protein [Planctomycetaceae bacterium]